MSVTDTLLMVLFITEVHKQDSAHSEIDLSYIKVIHEFSADKKDVITIRHQ